MILSVLKRTIRTSYLSKTNRLNVQDTGVHLMMDQTEKIILKNSDSV